MTEIHDPARSEVSPIPEGTDDPAAPEVHLIVPEGIDDPARPSGGNTYDRRVRDGLTALGWSVHELAVPGAWPRAGAPGHVALANALRAIPDDATVLLDGLIASAAPEALVGQALRLRQVVLVHMPLGHRPPDGEALEVRARERAVLAAAAAVITTSAWTTRRLDELYALPADRMHVAEPGVDGAALAPGTAAGGELLCVAAVTPDKGHDVLLEALATVAAGSWRCTCVGSLDRDPEHAAAVRYRAQDLPVVFTGPQTGAALDRAYAEADLLVLASYAETYGLVVTEALARGLPVLATDVGGVPEALGHAENGTRPGLLVPPGDPAALGAPLRRWLGDAELRERLRRAARERRAALRGWPETTSDVARALTGVMADADGEPPKGAERVATDADGERPEGDERVATDADGEPPKGAERVATDADGEPPKGAERVATDADGEPPKRAEGVVTGADGEPPKGAEGVDLSGAAR